MLNMMHRYGYGNWEVIRMEIRKVFVDGWIDRWTSRQARDEMGRGEPQYNESSVFRRCA